MKTMIPIIIGYEMDEREDSRTGLQLADFGYAKPETNATKREEFLAALTSGEIRPKMLCRMKRVVALDLARKARLDTAKLPDGCKNHSHAFLLWLLDAWKSEIEDQAVEFYGFDLKPFLRVLGPEGVDAGIQAPRRLWYANDNVYNPYEMLVEAEYRKQILLPKVLARIGMRLPDTYKPGKDAMADMKLTAAMVFHYRLVSQASREVISDAIALNAEPKEELQDSPNVKKPAAKAAKKK